LPNNGDSKAVICPLAQRYYRTAFVPSQRGNQKCRLFWKAISRRSRGEEFRAADPCLPPEISWTVHRQSV